VIAVDTSALVAVLLREPEGPRCSSILSDSSSLVLSAATLAEALVVASRRNVGDEMSALIDLCGFEIVPVIAATALRISAIYATWGKGRHPAALNFGDCFSYDTAKTHNCPLLFIGGDFSKTDLKSVL
jgi:ribonuclease VapC